MAGPLTERGADEREAHRKRLLAAASEWSLFEGMRRPWLTVGLTTTLLVIHLALGTRMYLNGRVGPIGLLLARRPPALLDRAGGQSAADIDAGELWRLVSCIFLHQDGLHLLLNGLAFVGLGRLCESIFGRARLLALFVVSGMCGSTLSYLGGTELSVGASGAVFGLLAAPIVFGWRFREELPTELGRALRLRLLPWAGLNLAIGALIPFIDNLAHLGGLFGGAALAAVFSPPVVPGREGHPWTGRVLVAGSLALIGWAAFGVAGNWR